MVGDAAVLTSASPYTQLTGAGIDFAILVPRLGGVPSAVEVGVVVGHLSSLIVENPNVGTSTEGVRVGAGIGGAGGGEGAESDTDKIWVEVGLGLDEVVVVGDVAALGVASVAGDEYDAVGITG